MTEDELKQYLHRKIDTALNDESGDVSELRQYNYNRYYGKEYGNERDGYSSFTTREGFEAVEWALPGILRVFTSADKAVEFVPEHHADEDQAAQETDIANHYLQQENNGFLMLHNWAKDILMNPNGYVKVWVDEITSPEFTNLSGITLENLNALSADKNVEILEAEESEEPVVVGGVPVTLYSVRLKQTRTKRELKIESVPPDQVLVDDDLAGIDLDEAGFVCHRVRKTISDLVEQGYDYERLIALGDSEGDQQWNDERVNRLFYEEESPDRDDDEMEAGPSKKLWVHECSVKVDYDGDNIAERRRIVMIGSEIFENEPDSYQPLIACSSIIMPHKHVGMAYIEAVTDLQLLSTTLTRQMLDNLYKQNVRRHFINEDALLTDNSTLDDFMDARSEAVIVRGNPAEAVMPEVVQSITGELLEAIKHVKDQPQLRTGVAPSLSLDPSVLQQSTMGAFMGALDQATQRQEMLVRLLAEVGYKPAMRKVHYLIRTHLNQPGEMKIRGQWVSYDPSNWPERHRLTVNVGLGNNTRQQKIELLMGVLGLQKEALAQGLADAPRIYHTLGKLIDTGSLGSVSSFFVDPKSPEFQPPEPQPDPTMIMAQAQAQALTAEQQRKMQELQVKSQMDMQKMQAELAKTQQDLRMAQEELDLRRIESMAKRDAEDERLDHESAKTIADVRHKNRDADLKEAQRRKVLAEAGLKDAEEGLKRIEATEEYREAQDIVKHGLERPETEGAGDSENDSN